MTTAKFEPYQVAVFLLNPELVITLHKVIDHKQTDGFSNPMQDFDYHLVFENGLTRHWSRAVEAEGVTFEVIQKFLASYVPVKDCDIHRSKGKICIPCAEIAYGKWHKN